MAEPMGSNDSSGLCASTPGCRRPTPTSLRRLPAIRTRDLTLGAAKKTPNLVTRKTKDNQARRPQLVQTRSIFEERPSEMTTPKRRVARKSAAPHPPPVTKTIKMEIEEIPHDDDDVFDDPSLRSDAERSCPVQLPLAVSGWAFEQGRRTAEPEKVERDAWGGRQGPAIRDEREEPPPLPESDLLPDLLRRWRTGAGEEALFVQLPDSLPGPPPPPAAKEARQQKQQHGGGGGCKLRDLREGWLGKMVVRRSGRVQLVLQGGVVLDVGLGAPCAFLQDLVSIGTDGGRVDLTVLGHVGHKLVCTPDFEALLDRR